MDGMIEKCIAEAEKSLEQAKLRIEEVNETQHAKTDPAEWIAIANVLAEISQARGILVVAKILEEMLHAQK